MPQFAFVFNDRNIRALAKLRALGFRVIGIGKAWLSCKLQTTVDFINVIKNVVGALDAAGVRYAMIGGFAMALRGLQRTTADLDFILALEDMKTADALLRGLGYARVFHSENVSHYESPSHEWGESTFCMLFAPRASA